MEWMQFTIVPIGSTNEMNSTKEQLNLCCKVTCTGETALFPFSQQLIKPTYNGITRISSNKLRRIDLKVVNGIILGYN